jgi:hypothetical protein
LTSSGTKRGFFTKQDFVFDTEKDLYTCLAGVKTTKSRRLSNRKGDIDHYRYLPAYFICALKQK